MLHFLMFAGGLAALVVGADLLVRGASRRATAPLGVDLIEHAHHLLRHQRLGLGKHIVGELTALA